MVPRREKKELGRKMGGQQSFQDQTLISNNWNYRVYEDMIRSDGRTPLPNARMRGRNPSSDAVAPPGKRAGAPGAQVAPASLEEGSGSQVPGLQPRRKGLPPYPLGPCTLGRALLSSSGVGEGSPEEWSLRVLGAGAGGPCPHSQWVGVQRRKSGSAWGSHSPSGVQLPDLRGCHTPSFP